MMATELDDLNNFKADNMCSNGMICERGLTACESEIRE